MLPYNSPQNPKRYTQKRHKRQTNKKNIKRLPEMLEFTLKTKICIRKGSIGIVHAKREISVVEVVRRTAA